MKPLNYDPELPNGCQDGDFELHELLDLANAETQARKANECTHGFRQGLDNNLMKCNYCGKTASREGLDKDRKLILAMYK